MRILVFGGTRGVGRFFVSSAAAAGHRVTVVARDPDSALAWLPPSARGLRGDARDRDAIQAAVAGHDAVVVSLGPHGADRFRHFVGRAARWIVEAMEIHGVKRLLLVSGLGVGRSRRESPASMRWFLAPILLRATFTDRAIAEEAVVPSRLDWTIVRPLWLTDGPPTGRWRATLDGRTVRDGIPRADVAAFLLKELEAPAFLRQAVALESA